MAAWQALQVDGGGERRKYVVLGHATRCPLSVRKVFVASGLAPWGGSLTMLSPSASAKGYGGPAEATSEGGKGERLSFYGSAFLFRKDSLSD